MTDTRTLLGLALPTNEPNTAFDYILSSLDWLKDISKFSTFLINFQKPWTPDLIEKAVRIINGSGFRVKYSYNSYTIERKGEIPINKIRNDSVKLMPEAKYYALVDDDMTFGGPTNSVNSTSGRQYLETIHYMLTHSKCGMTLMGGSLVKKVPKYHIGPVDIINTYVTGHGFIVKNMSPEGYIMPKDSINLVGSDEEKLVAGFILSHGLYPAKMGFSKTRHYENHRKNKLTSGTDTYGWANPDIINKNNVKYIRDHYKSTYGDGAPHSNDVCDKELYLKNGGIDVWDKSVVENLTVDYSKYTNDKLKKEILKNLGVS